jgi:hypothetical protein
MLIRTYCAKCKRTVAAVPLMFSGEEFWWALRHDEEVEVMHVSHRGDHLWKLDEDEKRKLSEQRPSPPVQRS